MEIERAARLSALLQHPAWPELATAVEEKTSTYMAAVASALLATGKLPDDFEYKRGFHAGMKAVVRQPDVAVAALERDVKKHREEQLV